VHARHPDRLAKRERERESERVREERRGEDRFCFSSLAAGLVGPNRVEHAEAGLTVKPERATPHSQQ
jgi:hypothetical protein